MPRVYFLTYEQDGRKGNDFTMDFPFKWLVDQRKKYPKTILSIDSFIELSLNQNDFNEYDALVGIDVDNKILMDRKREAGKQKPVVPTKEDINGDIIKPSKSRNRKHNNTNK